MKLPHNAPLLTTVVVIRPYISKLIAGRFSSENYKCIHKPFRKKYQKKCEVFNILQGHTHHMRRLDVFTHSNFTNYFYEKLDLMNSY